MVSRKSGRAKKINPNFTISAVTEVTRVPIWTLKSSCRLTKTVEARHIAMYLLWSIYDMTYEDIGLVFNRKYTTVMSAIKNLDIKPGSKLWIKVEYIKSLI